MKRSELDSLDKDQTVDGVMRRWPATIRVFIEYRMLCIGCPIGPLHTIEEACTAHSVDATVVLRALQEVAHRSRPEAQAESDLPSATNNSL